MFSPTVAKILGIILTSGERRVFRGLGGDIEAYLHRIRFRIGPVAFRARVAFPTTEVPNLIGRLDVMKKSNIVFKDEREVSIESLP